ncbi:hypothetical protein [Methylobacterium nodulans]|uniref:Uncharacterized protein n=1 Tax=Methylobacterium nodulans (strain LMG 21967 / CNCM I-2342 / ORS 2060) TaxID=460265 RepID=B8IA84_METNO|nr:hypothetical protein [Methylobacterium nodulans]ACL59147.1 conserved hypothetical protein [Methylobacterium nodulans ORS 2060]
MARNARTTITAADVLLQAATVALAGLTALAALARLDADSHACRMALPVAGEQRTAPVSLEGAEDAVLRDMLLHD